MENRVVKDTMLGLEMPDIAVWSSRVVVVLGQNPGVFTGPGTNTFLVGTGASPLLIDTGQGVPAYFPLLDRALREKRGASRPGSIVLTHSHPDHAGGVAGLRDRYPGIGVFKFSWPERDGDACYQPLRDGDVIQTEGATLRAIWTPGHARDHVCFYCPEERALFTGDLVLGAGTTVIPADGDLDDYLRSLRRLLELDAQVIYPAHGPMISDAREKIESYLAHRSLREQQVLDVLARVGSATVAELVRSLYADVPELLHGAAALNVAAHLGKLEREGKVVPTGDAWQLA